MRRLIMLAVCSLPLLITTQVRAGTVTIQASGITDTISQTPALNELLGLELSLTAVYSDTAADSNPAADTGNYTLGLISVDVTLGGQTLTNGAFNSLLVGNDYGGPTFFDEFSISSGGTGLNVSYGSLGPYNTASVGMRLSDSSQTVFSSDLLPTALDLLDFDLAFLTVGLQPQTNGLNTRVDATIRSLTVTYQPDGQVPVPATLLLISTALFALTGMRTFGKRRS